MLPDEAEYICENCGEEIVVPIDPSEGHEAEYVEDCPICCAPNVIHIHLERDGEAIIDAHGE